jgi:hypothetical protein
VKPNFLGIGAIKAGTTWAADILAAHPQVFMAHGKELHYFSRQFDRGLNWYLDKFSDAKPGQAIGEFSVTYMDGSEDTARRIYEFDPGLHLIVSVRDPVERAFSQYRWEKQMGQSLPSFPESLNLRPDLITNSLYAQNLEPFWRLFPQSQFFYIRQSDLAGNASGVARALYEFLGVDPDYSSPQDVRVVGETIQPRSRLLEDLRIRLHQGFMQYGLERLITTYRTLGLSRLYRRINNDDSQRELLSEADRSALAGKFTADLARFEEVTGISIQEQGATQVSNTTGQASRA